MVAMWSRFNAIIREHIRLTLVLLRTGETRVLEFVLGVITLSWGLMMSHPNFSNPFNPIHPAFTSIAPLWVWDTMMVSTGILQILATIQNDFKMRRRCSLFGVFLFAFISVAFWRLPFSLPGQVIIPVYCFASIVSYCQLGEYARWRAHKWRTVTGRSPLSSGPELR